MVSKRGPIYHEKTSNTAPFAGVRSQMNQPYERQQVAPQAMRTLKNTQIKAQTTMNIMKNGSSFYGSTPGSHVSSTQQMDLKNQQRNCSKIISQSSQLKQRSYFLNRQAYKVESTKSSFTLANHGIQSRSPSPLEAPGHSKKGNYVPAKYQSIKNDPYAKFVNHSKQSVNQASPMHEMPAKSGQVNIGKKNDQIRQANSKQIFGLQNLKSNEARQQQGGQRGNGVWVNQVARQVSQNNGVEYDVSQRLSKKQLGVTREQLNIEGGSIDGRSYGQENQCSASAASRLPLQRLKNCTLMGKTICTSVGGKNLLKVQNRILSQKKINEVDEDSKDFDGEESSIDFNSDSNMNSKSNQQQLQPQRFSSTQEKYLSKGSLRRYKEITMIDSSSSIFQQSNQSKSPSRPEFKENTQQLHQNITISKYNSNKQRHDQEESNLQEQMPPRSKKLNKLYYSNLNIRSQNEPQTGHQNDIYQSPKKLSLQKSKTHRGNIFTFGMASEKTFKQKDGVSDLKESDQGKTVNFYGQLNFKNKQLLRNNKDANEMSNPNTLPPTNFTTRRNSPIQNENSGSERSPKQVCCMTPNQMKTTQQINENKYENEDLYTVNQAVRRQKTIVKQQVLNAISSPQNKQLKPIKAVEQIKAKLKKQVLDMPVTFLDYHNETLQKKMNQIQKQVFNIDEIDQVKQYMSTNFIKCYKYNSTLDMKMQYSQSNQALIELSHDHKRLIITNRIPTNSTIYTNEYDPEKLRLFKETQFEKLKIMFDQRSKQTREDMRKDPDFKEKVSSASCDLSQIQNFIFGGFSSRFWVYRKHIISLKSSQLQHLPFYSWQCITIQLNNRDIDLVIPNDEDMNKFLKLLIHSMETTNGFRGSGVNLIKTLNNQVLEDLKKQKNLQSVSKKTIEAINKTNRHKVFRKIFLRYLIIRWRAKISLLALQKRQTIIEYFHNTILRSLKELINSGEIPDICSDQKIRNDVLLDAMNRPRLKGFILHIQRFNNNKFPEKWLEEKIENILQKEKQLKMEHGDCEQDCGDLQIDYLKCLVHTIKCKDNANDIFKYVEIRDGNVNNNQIEVTQALNEKQYVSVKQQIRSKKNIIMNHQMATSMHAISGIPFIVACLKRIELTKDIFALQVDQGLEVIIPRSLSQSHLPLSFRYYDSVISIVRVRVQPATIQQFIDKSHLSFQIHKQNDFMLKFRENFILGRDRKLTFKLNPLNKVQGLELDHQNLAAVKQIQRGSFLSIDANLAKKHLFENYKQYFDDDAAECCDSAQNKQAFKIQEFMAPLDLHNNVKQDLEVEEMHQLELRFRPFPEIQKKYKDSLDNKAKFLTKVAMLRYQGKQFEIAEKIDSWVESNKEKLFNDVQFRSGFLSLTFRDKKKTENFRRILTASDKDVEKQMHVFQEALKDFIFSEILFPKYRLKMYQNKMLLLDGIHPTINYQDRINFIEQNIKDLIQWFNPQESKKTKDELDLGHLYSKIRRNNKQLIKREMLKQQPNFRFLLQKRLKNIIFAKLAKDQNYSDRLLLQEIEQIQDYFRMYVFTRKQYFQHKSEALCRIKQLVRRTVTQDIKEESKKKAAVRS